MKLQTPEYLLCEDPASETENLFIYHAPSRSLIHIIHTGNLTQKQSEKVLHKYGRHLVYNYRNTAGNMEKIMFVIQITGTGTEHPHDEQTVLTQCAHWYTCYLGWEKKRTA